MSAFYFLLFLLLCMEYGPVNADDPWSTPPNVYPRSQKIAENSPAVFTCVSYIPGADITWYKFSQPLNEAEDEVTIRKINDVTSVLRIDKAQIKKHKKSYTCRVEFEGRSEDISLNLKVMAAKRLHKNFPHIAPVRSGDELMIPSTDPNTIRMKCASLANKKNIPTWRWIKDDVIDLSVDEASDDETKDRIEITDDGELIIEDVRGSDSGRYTCVARNNRGSSYGTPVQVTVQQGPPVPRGCVDDLGVRSDFGETYNRNGDPCTNCTCVEGVGVRCRSVTCFPKRCPSGQRSVKVEGTCCEFNCVPDIAAPVSRGCEDDLGVKSYFGETYIRPGDLCTNCTCDEEVGLTCQSVSCVRKSCPFQLKREKIYGTCCEYKCVPDLDYDSVVSGCGDDLGAKIYFGETYTRTDDPCTNCTCVKEGKECQSVSCLPKRCNHGQRRVKIEGTCCKYICVPDTEHSSMCTDRDGIMVASGQVFKPEQDPCLQCICDDGKRGPCKMTKCQAPTCADFVASRDICCQYTCLPTPPEPSKIDVVSDPWSCRDHKGEIIQEGDQYNPDPSDPCKYCECISGQMGFCTRVICDEPQCRNYTLIPGTCCGFECHDDDEIESVEIDLDGGCRTYDGTYVGNGDMFRPRADTCTTCMCSDGYPTHCRSIDCDPPEPIPENVEKVLGRIFMQQIGSDRAFIQWKIPEKYDGKLSKLTLFCSKNSLTSKPDVISIGDRPYAILNDLDLNIEYHVMVNGTLGGGTAFMSSRPVSFYLEGRGRPSFVLSDAIGQVFESRGSTDYDGYSFPRKFEPVVRTPDVKMVLNTASFHRIDITRYNESPCMDQYCGLLRFYIYTVEGESKNALSLMFTNEQDFSWAKAHL